jgi:hypothetical protein
MRGELLLVVALRGYVRYPFFVLLSRESTLNSKKNSPPYSSTWTDLARCSAVVLCPRPSACRHIHSAADLETTDPLARPPAYQHPPACRGIFCNGLKIAVGAGGYVLLTTRRLGVPRVST